MEFLIENVILHAYTNYSNCYDSHEHANFQQWWLCDLNRCMWHTISRHMIFKFTVIKSLPWCVPQKKKESALKWQRTMKVKSRDWLILTNFKQYCIIYIRKDPMVVMRHHHNAWKEVALMIITLSIINMPHFIFLIVLNTHYQVNSSLYSANKGFSFIV